MGRPIVASSLGAQTETIADGVTGFLFPSGDAEALAKGIEKALAMTADERTAMAKAARENVLGAYTVDVMCEATLRIYRDLMSARPSTA